MYINAENENETMITFNQVPFMFFWILVMKYPVPTEFTCVQSIGYFFLKIFCEEQ